MRIFSARNSAGVRDRDTARDMVRRAVEHGINFIGTADIYGVDRVLNGVAARAIANSAAEVHGSAISSPA
ncbi:MAG: aldo/keto reductase [Sphingomonadaceae bacterium]|nr:aldo/keto reductase [Sphingomonadaceae bacterium]